MQPRTRLANDTLRFAGRLPFPIPSYSKVNYRNGNPSVAQTQQHHHQHSLLARDYLECLNSTLILEIILLTPDEIHSGEIAVSASALFCVKDKMYYCILCSILYKIQNCWDSSKQPCILNQPLFIIAFFKS